MRSYRIMSLVILWSVFSCDSTAKESSKDSVKTLQQDSVELLLKYFKNRNTSIPEKWAEGFLKIEYYSQAYSGCYSEMSFQKEDLTYLIVRLKCNAGTKCESKMLITLKKGSVVGNLTVGKKMGDQTFNSEVDYTFINEQLIELLNVNREYEIDFESEDEEKVLKTDTSFLEYYSISIDGEITKVENPRKPFRKYSETSYRVLSEDMIGSYSKDELDVMRNEIFASYGYEFESDKWKEYFGSKDWYEPRTKDVNDLLSPIELINVQRILEASKK